MLDSLDRKLLQLLAEDGRASSRILGGQLGVSAPTVLARIRRLEDLGAIVGYGANIAAWAAITNPSDAAGTNMPTCHYCHGTLPKAPVEAKIGGRHHVFCCRVCRDQMIDKASRFSTKSN